MSASLLLDFNHRIAMNILQKYVAILEKVKFNWKRIPEAVLQKEMENIDSAQLYKSIF